MPQNTVTTFFDHIDAATLTAGGVLLGAAPAPVSILRIVNDSANSCFILGSNDGGSTLIAIDYVAPNSFLQVDFQANASPPSHLFLLRQGDLVYVSSTTTHAGAVTVSFYCQQNTSQG